ncbi:MAG TPA: NADH-quinone oxidoreductase subunit J, partial [Gemmatales bacterium]|nr:NADH-quinone oxidoreductase subunit J [Gemmatales bacterium]
RNFSPKTDPRQVVELLAEASAVTGPDRYRRTGKEILELLTVQGKPVEAVMQKMFTHLNAWPEAAATRADASKAWEEARKFLQEDQAPAAHAALGNLHGIALKMSEAYDRYSGVLSVTTTPVQYQSQLSARRSPKEPDHVNELGRSIYGDYLYAVELAGTLLLVATIAAILIAQESERRKKVQA